MALEQQLSIQIGMERQQQYDEEQQQHPRQQQQKQVADAQVLSVGQLRSHSMSQQPCASPLGHIAPKVDIIELKGTELSSHATPPHTLASLAEVFSPPSAGQAFGEGPNLSITSPLTPVSVSPKM
jgi:hypothetical protein